MEGIGLAGLTAGLAVLAVHLDDTDPSSGEEAGDAGPIGARPLHADLSDVTERLEPGEQGRVPLGVGPKGLGAEQASHLVEGGGYVNLPVGVDSTGDGTTRLLRWSCHPFLSLSRLRGGTAVPRRMTVEVDLL